MTLSNDFIKLQVTREGGVLAHVESKFILFKKIKSKYFESTKLSNLREKLLQGKAKEATLSEEVLRIRGSMCVRCMSYLISTILTKAHNLIY